MAVLPAQIAAGVIIVVLALRALEANEGVLAHRNEEYRIMNKESSAIFDILNSRFSILNSPLRPTALSSLPIHRGGWG
jgi:hypothetical protein